MFASGDFLLTGIAYMHLIAPAIEFASNMQCGAILGTMIWLHTDQACITNPTWLIACV